MKDLEALQRANFDWVVHTDCVWTDHPFHVPGINEPVEQEVRLYRVAMVDEE